MTQHDSLSQNSVAELVREIAQALVDEPAAVEVQSVDREENTVLKLRVARRNMQNKREKRDKGWGKCAP